ncbi:cobalamin-dependent protein [Desulfosporosinus sp. PR]|uniref:cobalamin B12-binding domain-containing protein n=1 Tax=Candidatus Desulfosporosinus nitrosoreducens TaxID=3401928 RepID=UPI0027FE66B6|nr:cobalamin-dependent protein [Desulfosporosinus sp. PR]MDQ7093574.1 cobalamin-dependent protein [Desulfosporosinus sp. PR]
MYEAISKHLAELEEDSLLALVKDSYDQGAPVFDILAALQKGMEEVGQKFEAKEYFLSELIMSADVFKEATGLLGDAFGTNASETLGTVVMGTVKEDIHDIGKDIVVTILKCNGFNVIDLGVDVPYERFVEAIKEHNPQIIGLSCLLTSAFDNMKGTIAAIEEAGLREGRTVLIGGGPTDQKVKDYVGADGLCRNAQEAVEACKKIMGVN